MRAAPDPPGPSTPGRDRPARVRRILVRHGLLPGPGRITEAAELDVDGPRADGARGRRWREALHELGPVAWALGQYLASRADLLPLAACQALAGGEPPPAPGLADEDPPTRFLEQHLGQPLAHLFMVFDGTPSHRDLLGQSHFARLQDRRWVRVRITRARRLDELDDVTAELAQLRQPAFRRAWSGAPWHLDLGPVLDQLQAELALRLDLDRQAALWRSLHEKAGNASGLFVPEVVEIPGSSCVLVTESPPPREQITPDPDWPSRMSVAWLELALTLGRVELASRAVPVGEDGVAFEGDRAVPLGTGHRVRLWDYLRAVAAHDSDRALRALWPLLEGPAGAGDHGIELRARFRQAIPFRDGGFEQPGETLTEYVMLHWRWLHRLGYRLPAGPQAFFRGLFWISHRGMDARHELDERDPLERGLDALQWISGFRQLDRLTEPAELQAMSEGLGAALLQLPQLVDLLLDSDEAPAPGARGQGPGVSAHGESGAGFPAAFGSQATATLAITLATGTAALALALLDWAHGPHLPWLATAVPWLFAGLGLAYFWRVFRAP